MSRLKVASEVMGIVVGIGALMYNGYSTYSAEKSTKHLRRVEAAKTAYEFSDMYEKYRRDSLCVKWCVASVIQDTRKTSNRECVDDAVAQNAFNLYEIFVLNTDNHILSILNRIDAMSYFDEEYDEGIFDRYTSEVTKFVAKNQSGFYKIFRAENGHEQTWEVIGKKLNLGPVDKGKPADYGAFCRWVEAQRPQEFDPVPNGECQAKCTEAKRYLQASPGGGVVPATEPKAAQ